MKQALVVSIEAKESVALLASNIAEARDARSWSQAELAQRANVSRGTVRRIEDGDLGVSLGSIVAALDALGLTNGLSLIAARHLDEEGRRLRKIRGRHE